MSALSRRNFLSAAGSFALATAMPARAAMGPDDKFDLVIKGGDVLDPSQSLRGKRDIGIRYGLIEALEAEIPAARALRVLDAGGKLVTPGPRRPAHPCLSLWLGASAFRRTSSSPIQCTTTCVSAGDAGANNFAAFRRYIVAQTRTRLYRLRPHRQYRARLLPGGRALQHRLRAGRCLRARRSPRTPIWRSASRCACRRT